MTADINHDSHTDIITADYTSNDISVLLGNGDGTFETARSFPAGSSPTALVVGDWNGDGRLDVAVVDAGADPGVTILFGNGDGTFYSGPNDFYPVQSGTTAIAEGDFNGDGALDLAVADQNSSDVSILLGNGHGGFTLTQSIPLAVPGFPVAIAAGDFTGNGRIDLAVADQFNDSVSILEGDGLGSFVALPPVALGGTPLFDQPIALVAGNFSGHQSRILDVAVVTLSALGDPASVSVLLAQGNGIFAAPQLISLETEYNPSSMTVGVLVGGSALDLAIVDSDSGDLSLIAGDGAGGFTPMPPVHIDTPGSPFAIAVGDFTGDGRSDLAIATQSASAVAIELNQGNGRFIPPGAVGFAPHNTPLVADLNGDGLPDIAITTGAGDILFRQGLPNQPGAFDSPVTVNPGDPSRDIAAVITNSGTFLASVDATDNAVSLFRFANGKWGLARTLPTGIAPAQIVTADLRGNGEDDLVIRNAGDGTLTIYLSDHNGGFLPAITLTVGPGISDVSVADVNADGLADLLLANQTGGLVEVILNQGDGRFSPPMFYRAGDGLSALVAATDTAPAALVSQEGTVGVVAAALDPGGPVDILALNSGSESIGVLQGLGAGRFAFPISRPTNGPTDVIRTGDFNHDGFTDLAILGANGLTVRFGFGGGVFARGVTYNVGPDATGLTIADTNGDGLPDLVVGNAFGDVLVLRSEGNGNFQTPSPTDQNVTLAVGPAIGSDGPTFIYANQALDHVVVQNGLHGPSTVVADRTTGLLVPGAPVLADLNGDGIPDLIVPNSGGNSVFVYPGLAGGGFGPASMPAPVSSWVPTPFRSKSPM